MFDFQQFNEAATAQPKKPAAFRVGDLVKTISSYYSSESRGETFYNSYGGAILKVEKVEAKSGKWQYTGKIVSGLMSKNNRRQSIPYKSEYTLVRGAEKDFDKESVTEFTKIADTAKFKTGDDIDIPEGTKLVKLKDDTAPNKSLVKHLSKKVFSLAVDHTLQAGEPCYYIENVGVIKESDISSKTNLSPEAAEALANEMAKTLGTTVKRKNEKEFEFDYQTVKIVAETGYTKVIEGAIVINKEDSMKFQEELKKLISKYAKPDAQKAFGQSIKFDPRVNTYFPTIKEEDMVNAAKNLKMDVDKVLHDKRGHIGSKKFGL